MRNARFCAVYVFAMEENLEGVFAWSNKAIRDGKYLARHMPVLGNVHPIKLENIDIFS